MKRVITALVLITSLFALSVFSYKYIEKSTQMLSSDIKAVYHSVSSENYVKAESNMQKLYSSWSKRLGYMSSVCRHNEIDDISRIFQRTKQAIINRDKNDALVQLKELDIMVVHLLEMESPSISNIL